MIYDLVVIGAGPGGYAAALEASRFGARVALVEKRDWGGTCTHWGCIPTKALLACSKKYSAIKKLKRMGVKVADPSFDFAAMKRHQQQMVRVSAAGAQKSLKEAGVERIEGEGTILSPGEIDVVSSKGGSKRLEATNILIAWGSTHTDLPGMELSGRILGSREFLAMDSLPGSLVIVGAGAIGVEFATFTAELGGNVTLVELVDQILPTEEREAAEFLTNELKKLGIEVYTSTAVSGIEESEEGVRLRATHGGEDLEIAADYALICVGRRPLLRTEELDVAGIRYDRGGIAVDERFMTNVETIYAVGDVTGGILLAHRAMAQGRACANALFGDGSVTYTASVIPSVVYTHPAVAQVGLTEERAREEGLAIETKKVDYGSNMVARLELMGSGFVKTIFSDDRLVGATIVGEGAGELIAPMGLALANGMTKNDLRNWVIAHPTLTEIIGK